MKRISGKLQKLGVIILISFCVNVTLNAQTPADDPGIGGPGAGAAPAGDGSPIVPFDGKMSLTFLLVGIGYASFSLRKNLRTC